MSIESALEDSVISDFMRDPVLSPQVIRKHDYGQAIAGDQNPQDPEAPAVIIVTGTDRGEYKMGSGIRRMGMEIEVRVNGQADGFNGTLLDQLASAIKFRLMASPFVTATGRENTFSQNGIKVFGVLNGEQTQRTESGLERIRTVSVEFIASQVA